MQTSSADRELNLLILGGTGFLGPHIIEAALGRGHKMTLFNRGRTNPHLFPDLEKLRGDRDPDKGDGLSALEGRKFDAVIDTSGYVPRIVKASSKIAAQNANHYVFISTISVYPEITGDLDENSPVGTLEDETVEQVTGTTYGPLKALCEQAADAAMSGKAVTIRPHLIVGPGDTTDRFNYWAARLARGGEVLAPGVPEVPMQYVDVRDLAAFTIHSIEESLTGIYNAAGPGSDLTMGTFLTEADRALDAGCSFSWVPDDFLLEQGVGPWMELPLWIPREPSQYGRVSIEKIRKAGMTWRTVADTVVDTEKWVSARPEDYRWRAGLKPEKEAAVLEAWHARAKEAAAG